MLTLSNIAKSFGGRTLFENVSLQVNRGDRVALVGPNGAGKSTLFSIILKQQEPDDGNVIFDSHITMGYLPQESMPVADETVLQIATAISPEHSKWRRILDDCERTDDTSSDLYSQAQEEYANLGGFALDPCAKKVLKGLAFRDTDYNRQARTMSGGWVMRAHLARLLVMEPDLLILDEPTNHLDLECLGWFQNYLQSYPGAILMISHDRAFLNALIDQIFEIRSRKIHVYRGNYDEYVIQRAARDAQQLAAYENQQKEIESLQRFADRFRAKASKASQAQSKLKQIERMEKIEAPEASEKKVRIKFPQPGRGSQHVIRLEKVHHAYDDLVVYRGIDFAVERGQRTVLVGPNGAGKSTLLKILGGVIPVQQGTRTVGNNVQVGYFSQNRLETLDPNKTVIQECLKVESKLSEENIRTILGSFLFSGDDAYKKVAVLSGGEKTRLSLVKLLLNPPNLLLMDEPTTHLDIASIDALIEALKQYEGSLVFISHDVYFIRSLAQNVLHISAGTLTPYSGDYDYYLEKSNASSERSGLIAGTKLSDSRPREEAAHKSSSDKTSVFKTKEQKRQEALERQALSEERKKIRRQLQQVENEIEALEIKQKTLTAKLEDPETYKEGTNIMDLNRELSYVNDSLELLNKDWEQLSANPLIA
jgi:ATP-binding cassette, subfamily F, member 3